MPIIRCFLFCSVDLPLPERSEKVVEGLSWLDIGVWIGHLVGAYGRGLFASGTTLTLSTAANAQRGNLAPRVIVVKGVN